MGRKQTLATRRLLRMINLGKKNPMYGKRHTKAELEHLRRINRGKKNPMHGRHHTAATKRKISLTKKRQAQAKKKSK